MTKISSKLREYLESNGVIVSGTSEGKELSENAKMINWINHNNIKQMQQDLLNYYCNTLTLNDPMRAEDILHGYHQFIRTNPQYKEQYKQNTLAIRNTVILGLMLKKIPCMTKKFKSVNNIKSMYYWRKE